jgi:hypothetical protein
MGLYTRVKLLTICKKFVVIYSMTFKESQGPDAERAELNTRAIERAQDTAEKLRTEVIDLSFEAVKKFLQDDIEIMERLDESGFPEGEDVGFYVLLDTLSAPLKDGEYTRTLSVLLVRNDDISPLFPEEEDGYPHSNDDQLRVYVPVPNDYILGESELPNTDEVYVERVHEHEDSRSRYVISREGMYEYESIRDNGEEVIYDDFSDRVIWRRITRRVDSGLPILAVISEDLINMSAVPQRVITIGEPEVHDR